MPVISRILSMALRIGEIGFAGVILGLVASYLDAWSRGSGLPLARPIYMLVVACISVLLGLLWLLPFASGFAHWPVDLLISFAWFAAFGVTVDWMRDVGCGLDIFNDPLTDWSNFCGRWRTIEAFSILSAIFWILSALVGLWFIHRERRKVHAAAPVRTRRGFFRRHRV